MSIAKIFATSVDNSMVQFTEQVTRQGTWNFWRQLKGLKKDNANVKDVFVREGVNASRQLTLRQRIKETLRFLWARLRKKFNAVPEEKLAPRGKELVKPPPAPVQAAAEQPARVVTATPARRRPREKTAEEIADRERRIDESLANQSLGIDDLSRHGGFADDADDLVHTADDYLPDVDDVDDFARPFLDDTDSLMPYADDSFNTVDDVIDY